MPRLTKTVVDGAEPRPRQYSIWCSELKGFGVLVNPSGKRTYVVDYYTADHARRRMSIGVHGQITAEQARKLALETLGGVVIQKADPLDERRTRRQAMTMAELCDTYIEAMERGLILGKGGRPKKDSTVGVDVGRIRRHVVPLLGRKRVIDLSTADVARFLNDVTLGKTAVNEKTEKKRGRAIVEGGAGTASRTVGLLGGILTFAIARGIIDRNPVEGVRRPADGRRDRRLSDIEFTRLGSALASAPPDVPWQAIASVRLLCLTGARLGEIAGLKWSAVDLDGQTLRLADSKTGESVRPLGSAAVDVLRALPRAPGAPFVLPAVRKDTGAFGAVPAAVERFMKAAGIEEATAHTLRHSFASVAGDLNFSELTIAGLLGHRAASVTGGYIHRADAVMIAAANRVAGEIDRLMTGVTAKVVRLSRGPA